MGRHQGIVPAVRPGLLAEEVGREYVVFDTTTNQAHCLAPLVAAVFACCDGQTPIDDLPVLVGLRLGETVDAGGIDAALGQLENAHLLDAPSALEPRGMSRRAFVQRGAIATAGAAVLITTVATPAAAQSSPGGRCPESRCVSQSKGDEFCACNNVCPPDSPGAGGASSCTSLGLTPPYFDSCFCAQCPKPGDLGNTQAGAFVGRCLPPEQQTTPCGGGGAPNMGCLDADKHLDGICRPNDGDSSELCIHDT
jgi:hypothetical protein